MEREEIVDLILHPEEPLLNAEQSEIELQYLPICMVVKLDKTRATNLTTLDDCVIPIEPVSTKYNISVVNSDGKKSRMACWKNMTKRRMNGMTG